MRLGVIAGILLLLALPIALFALPESDTVVLVFHSPSCHDCIKVKETILPGIESKLKGLVSFEFKDLNDIDNFKLLLSLKEQYQIKDQKHLPVLYFRGHFLSGPQEIALNLESTVRRALVSGGKRPPSKGLGDIIKVFSSFTPVAIIGAGLIDGINPCAFAVIIFFISYLTLQGYRKKELVVIGLFFVLAVFLAYLLIGFGLFNFLYRLKAYMAAIRIINFVIGVLSLSFGVIALFDYFKFKRTGATEGLLLQLPANLKNRIHAVIGTQYRKNPAGEAVGKANVLRLSISAFATGFVVSVLEAVCTGQVYVPTLTLVLKTTHLKLQAFGYLLLYNFMFVVPLLAIFVLAVVGVTSGMFTAVFKKNFALIKLLMANLFFILGVLLLWR